MEKEIRIGKRLVTVGFMRRYDAAYRRIRLALRQGVIGSPKVVHSIHRNPSPENGYFWQRGITGVAIHDIDIISWLLEDRVDQVATISGGHGDEIEVQPLLISGRTMGGTVISIESFVNCGYGYDIGCEVVGTVGSMSLGPSDEIALRRDFHQTTMVPADYVARFEPAFVRQLQTWCETVRSETATGASLWDGLCASLVSDAAIRSKTSGALERVAYPAVPDIYLPS
jgi:myo-inositol 2-dehydrogenase/D-chiro-inositol 1-dehydrogenase